MSRLLLLLALSACDHLRPAPDELGVELLDPGQAPRTRLRYQEEAPPRSFNLVTQSGMYVMRGVLQGESTYLPAIAGRWDHVDGAAPDHVDGAAADHCARWRLRSAEVSDDENAAKTAAETKQVVGDLVGREVVTCVGPRGELRLDLPEPREARQRQILDLFRRAFELQFTIPLPREAVGKGARWRVKRTLPLAVDGIVHQLDYRLDDIADKGVDVALTIGFSAAPHRQPGTSVVVDDVEGKGEGRVVSMLKELTPVLSDISFETVMSLTPSAADKPDEEERRRGYKLVYRARNLMQAQALGPLDWEADHAAQ